MGNHAARKIPELKAWPDQHLRLRFQVHVTPASGPWLNLVEVWFSIIDRARAIRRSVVTSHERSQCENPAIHYRLEQP